METNTSGIAQPSNNLMTMTSAVGQQDTDATLTVTPNDGTVAVATPQGIDTAITTDTTDGGSDTQKPADVEEVLAELARVKAKAAKDKAAFDKTASELASLKKSIRKNQTEDEMRAEEEKERQAQIVEELNTLRKQAALAVISKKAFAFTQSEETANEIAEYLYGASDPEGALDSIIREWTRQRKELEVKYKNYGAPASGGQQISPEEQLRQKNIQMAKEMGRSRSAAMRNADNGLKKFMS